MPARVTGLLNALLLLNAPATERDFNVLRTALDLTFAFSFALDVAFSFALDVAFSFALDVAFSFFALRVAFRLELVSALLPTDLLRVLRVIVDRLRVLRALELVSALLPTDLLRVLRVIADRLRVLRAVERTTLPPELDRADERDIVGRALTRAPPPPRATPPACAAPPLA